MTRQRGSIEGREAPQWAIPMMRIPIAATLSTALGSTSQRCPLRLGRKKNSTQNSTWLARKTAVYGMEWEMIHES